jgi:carboxymethylenebutenolidase
VRAESVSIDTPDGSMRAYEVTPDDERSESGGADRRGGEARSDHDKRSESGGADRRGGEARSDHDKRSESGGADRRGGEARSDRDKRAAVVVIQEAFGVNEHIEDVARRFGDAGYRAIAPDLFHRGSSGTAEYGDWEAVMKLFASIASDADVLADVDATLEHLRGAGFSDQHIGIVGFCFGGRVTFLVSLHHALGAAVGFYGGGIVTARFPQFPALVERSASLQTPWLGLFGDEDASISIDDVEQLRRALPAAGVDTEVVRYADAGHGFHCDVRAGYHPDAAADAWRRTLAWLDARL